MNKINGDFWLFLAAVSESWLIWSYSEWLGSARAIGIRLESAAGLESASLY